MICDARLDESTFLLYAAQHYGAVGSASMSEFYEDLGRIKNVNRLVRRYARTAVLSERLILNHLVALYNVFDPPALTRMLVYKLYAYIDILKPFLVYLNYWPTVIDGIGAFGEIVVGEKVIGDPLIEARLKEL